MILSNCAIIPIKRSLLQYKEVKGLNWGPGAIGNATWTGVKLTDILKLAGVNENSNFEHVQVNNKIQKNVICIFTPLTKVRRLRYRYDG